MTPKCSITLELPLPPSTNRLWRVFRGRLIRSEEYRGWIKQAGLEILVQKPKLPCKAISGPYSLIVRLKLGNGRDSDNRVKALNDLLQKHGFIQNDNLCRKLLVLWNDKLEVDCRVTIRALTG